MERLRPPNAIFRQAERVRTSIGPWQFRAADENKSNSNVNPIHRGLLDLMLLGAVQLLSCVTTSHLPVLQPNSLAHNMRDVIHMGGPARCLATEAFRDYFCLKKRVSPRILGKREYIVSRYCTLQLHKGGFPISTTITPNRDHLFLCLDIPFGPSAKVLGSRVHTRLGTGAGPELCVQQY